jgi:hypothetical protein
MGQPETKNASVRGPQCRTRKNGILRVFVCIDELTQLIQPGQSIGVGKWLAAAHLLDVGGWVIVVGIEEAARHLRREGFTNSGLTRPSDTPDDDNHWQILGRF